MKTHCKGCDRDLSIDNFYSNNQNTRGYSYKCKSCVKAMKKERELARKHDPLVYYLPEENYCGVSTDITARVKQHKKLGKNIDGWKVLFCSEDKNEVLHMEAMYHSVMGMHGLNKATN